MLAPSCRAEGDERVRCTGMSGAGTLQEQAHSDVVVVDIGARLDPLANSPLLHKTQRLVEMNRPLVGRTHHELDLLDLRGCSGPLEGVDQQLPPKASPCHFGYTTTVSRQMCEFAAKGIGSSRRWPTISSPCSATR